MSLFPRTSVSLAVAILAGLGLAAVGASAQTPPDPPEPRHPGFERPRHGERPPGFDRERPHWGPRRPMSLLDRMLRNDAFVPDERDFGPFREGEAAEFEALMRERLPFMARIFEERGEDASRDRLRRMAPYLRMLRRQFDENPHLAQQMVRHIRARMFVTHLAPRMWGAARAPAERERIEREVFRALEEMHEVEAEVLRVQVERFSSPDERVKLADEYIAVVLDGESDIDREPPPVREIVEAWILADDDAGRDAARAELESFVAFELDRHAERLADRLEAHLRDQRVELDNRMRAAMRRLESPQEPRHLGPPGDRPEDDRPPRPERSRGPRRW